MSRLSPPTSPNVLTTNKVSPLISFFLFVPVGVKLGSRAPQAPTCPIHTRTRPHTCTDTRGGTNGRVLFSTSHLSTVLGPSPPSPCPVGPPRSDRGSGRVPQSVSGPQSCPLDTQFPVRKLRLPVGGRPRVRYPFSTRLLVTILSYSSTLHPE